LAYILLYSDHYRIDNPGEWDMQCERCKSAIPEGEEMELHGQVLCEDCYLDLLSPSRVCDPWAVHSAKTFLNNTGSELNLTSIQRKILAILQNEGPQEIVNLCKSLQIKATDIERELAALRHMEKIRGERKDGKKRIRLW
jgi:hypothetical protein